MNQLKFRRKLGTKNKTTFVNLPKELVEWIGAEIGEDIILIPDEGKHGKFIALFTEDSLKSENNVQLCEQDIPAGEPNEDSETTSTV